MVSPKRRFLRPPLRSRPAAPAGSLPAVAGALLFAAVAAAEEPRLSVFDHPDDTPFWASGQLNVIFQGHPSFSSPYEGTNSLIARPEGRIHFAGEHTSVWMRWMQGALESGHRAAREIYEAE